MQRHECSHTEKKYNKNKQAGIGKNKQENKIKKKNKKHIQTQTHACSHTKKNPVKTQNWKP